MALSFNRSTAALLAQLALIPMRQARADALHKDAAGSLTAAFR